MKRYVRFAILAVLFLLLSACRTTTTFVRCVEFTQFPDNTQMGPSFTVLRFDFVSNGQFDPFVNDVTTNVHGLQFAEGGMTMDVPSTASQVDLQVGAFAGQPVTVEALNSAGSAVDSDVVPATNSVQSISLAGSDITTVSFVGGGGEGVLVEACSYSDR